ncbi:hypothetical protein [Microbacterium oleivorans]|uniref:Uncharacterized protein n=1 Tax=Microbacterium oleivorans TaxID=273677 RepID=A0A4R5YK38_9MICO|nr:hypothetical protein [Microbacterium oleivorans]TDL45298.1 hypothetical protein E2R54_02200 [Microbacterium oleivorans]
MHQSVEEWRAEFAPEQLQVIRSVVPTGIHLGQVRSARAHTEYDDPDQHEFVYGVGMAHAAQKECQALLRSLPNYSEEKVPRSPRMLMRVGDHVVHVQRVGKKMPRNHRRLNLRQLSDTRRETLAEASNSRFAYTPEALFDLEETGEAHAEIGEAMEASSKSKKGMLLVPYYSSTPAGVGQMFLAPAVLAGNYLEFTDPEPLVYRRTGDTTASSGQQETQSKRRFAVGERPRSAPKLRRPQGPDGSR